MKILNRGAESAKSDAQEMVEAMQQHRSQALVQLRNLQLAARLLAQAEAGRLARKDPGDARLAAFGGIQSTLRDRVTVLDTELEVAAIRVPPVSKTEAMVHGRVSDDAQRATPRIGVALVLAEGRAVEGLKPVVTDDSGYYAFVITPAMAANLPGDQKFTLAVTAGETTLVPAAAGSFTLAAGKVEVRDLALTDAELKKLQLREATPAAEPPATRTVRAAPKKKGED